MVSQKKGVIDKFRDEACTLCASEWLVFRRKASLVFLILSFNFLVLAEYEVGESDSDREDGLRVFSTAPSSTFLPGDPVVEAAQALASDT